LSWQPSHLRASPFFDRDHLHAHTVAFAHIIFGRPETVTLQECVKTAAGKIVIMLNLSPIGINAIGVQKPPYHAVHVWHGEKEHAILSHQFMRGDERDFRKGYMFEHIGHADDALARFVIEFFNRLAISLIA
jgi:hypothetical protein